MKSGRPAGNRSRSTILISAFHPDHIFGLMEKGTDSPIYPQAESWSARRVRVVTIGRCREAARRGARRCGQRVQNRVPDLEELSGSGRRGGGRSRGAHRHAPGHTPGHSAFSEGFPAAASQPGGDLDDTAYVPALLAPHPNARRLCQTADGGRDAAQLLDRVIARR